MNLLKSSTWMALCAVLALTACPNQVVVSGADVGSQVAADTGTPVTGEDAATPPDTGTPVAADAGLPPDAASLQALLELSDGPTFDFGNVVIGAAAEHSFTLSNTGLAAATTISPRPVLAAPFAFKGGTYPGTGGTCTDTLAAGASCTFLVTFSPTLASTSTSQLGFTYNAGSVSIDMAGTGVTAASLLISDGPTFDFGMQAVGSATDHSFTVTNSGGSAATGVATGTGLAAPFAYKGGSYPGTGGTCAATLAAGANCTVVVTFSPTAAAVVVGTLPLSYNDGAAAQTASVGLKGSATAPALLAISDGAVFDFGAKATGSTGDHTFVVTNSGGSTATGVTPVALVAPFSFKGTTYPGTGGTCAATLASAATCTLVVTWAPTALGISNATLQLDYQSGLAAASASVGLRGDAVGPAQLVVSDGPTYDFGTHAVGVATDHSFTVSNGGGVSATALTGGALSAPFVFKGGSFPGTGGTCSGTSPLAPSGTCTVVVTFTPTAGGPFSATLSVGYNDGVGAQTATRALAGTGTSRAAISISDGPSFDFGTHGVGSATDHSFTLSSTGAQDANPLTPTAPVAPFSFKGGSYPGTGGTCGALLAKGSTCIVVVTFSPTAQVSSVGTLSFTFTDGTGPQTASVALAGAGTNQASLAISDAPAYDFGPVVIGNAKDRALTVTNTGAGPASAMSASGLAAPIIFKGGAYPGTGGNCAATLAAGSSCTLVVHFTPTQAGPATATLSVAYNDGLAAQSATRALAGTGVTPAVLALSDTPSYDFGNLPVGGTATHLFTLNNTGGYVAGTLSASGLNAPFALAGAWPGTGGTCAASLPPSTSCTFAVSFSPTAVGPFNGGLTVNYDDGTGPTSLGTTLRGTGAAPAAITISDASPFDFGGVVTGLTFEHTFTLTNSGGVAATAMGSSGPAAPFAFKGSGTWPGTGGTCGATLAPAGACTAVVVFSPTAKGPASADLIVAFNDGAGARTSIRHLTGTGLSSALLAFSGYDWGARPTGAGYDHTFTVTNSGDVAASSIVADPLGAGFAFKGSGTWPGTGGTCGVSLAAGASCTAVVTFTPTQHAPVSTVLKLSYNDGAAARSVSQTLSGSGIVPAALTFSPASLAFPTLGVGGEVDLPLGLLNGGDLAATGITPASLAAPFSWRGGAWPGIGGTCAASLAPGAGCVVYISFAPTVAQAFTGTLSLSYSDGAGGTPVANAALSGTATNGPNLIVLDWQKELYVDYGILLDGPVHSFGSVGVNRTAEHTFYVYSTGGADAASVSGTLPAGPFKFKGGTWPGSGGTCGATVASGDFCTVVVDFVPTAPTSSSANLSVTWTGGTVTRSLSGTGTLQAVIELYDFYDASSGFGIDLGTAWNFQTVGVGQAAEHTFYLVNNGAQAAATLAGVAPVLPFAFKGGTWPGAGGSCATSLAAGASCSLVVVFSPAAVGPASGTVGVNYNDGSSPQTVTRGLSGTGTNAALLVFESAGLMQDFGVVAAGSTADQRLTLINVGASTAINLVPQALAPPFSFKGITWPGVGGNCTTSLAAGKSCTLIVTFAPVDGLQHQAQIAIAYGDGQGGTPSVRLGLSGTGTNYAYLAISDWNGYSGGGGIDSPYDFGVAGQSVDHTFYVTNRGPQTATAMNGGFLSPPFTYKGGPYPGQGGTCAASLGAGQTCTVVVTFSPVADGPFGAALSIGYYDGGRTRSAARGLAGTGTTRAFLEILDCVGCGMDPNPVDFGTAGRITDRTLVVANTGAQTANNIHDGGGMSSFFLYKDGPYPGTGGTCGLSLAAGGNCTIVVSFKPQGNGPASSTLTLTFNDPSAQTVTRGLLGTSTTAAVLELRDQSGGDNNDTSDFGTWGVPVDRTFQLTNVGAQPASMLTDGGTLTPGFSFKGGPFPGQGGSCLNALASGASCTVVVAFTPTLNGPYASTLSVAYYDGTKTTSVSRDLVGTGVTTAWVKISEWSNCPNCGDGSSPYDYGTWGTAIDHTFWLTNVGAMNASMLNDGGMLAPPFAFKGGPFPGQGGTCSPSTPLAPNGTCSVVVTFNPFGNGQWTSTLKVNYYDGTKTTAATRSLTGAGTAFALLKVYDDACPDCGNNSGPFDYGTRGVATDHTFYLVNTGAQNATAVTDAFSLADGFAFKGGPFPGMGGTCSAGAPIAPMSPCSVVVTFTPGANGSHQSTLKVNYWNGNQTVSATRALVGAATNLAVVLLSDWSNCPGCGGNPSFDFGTSGVPVDHTFWLSNVGGQSAGALADGNALGASFSYKGGVGFPGQGGTCIPGGPLAQNATCSVVVTFNPTGDGGRGGTLTVNFNDGSKATSVARDLSATATTKAMLTIADCQNCGSGSNPQPADFGLTGQPVERTFYITNTGAQTAGLTNVFSAFNPMLAAFGFKGGNFPGQNGTCTASIAKGTTCTVVVVFTPSGSQQWSTNLALSYNDGGTGNTLTRALTGTSTNLALLTVTDCQNCGTNSSPFDFGTWGYPPVSHTFYLTNSGAVMATAMGGSFGPGTGFSFTGAGYPGAGGNCGATLIAGTSCVVEVVFTPAGSGPMSSTLNINYWDSTKPAVGSRALRGTATMTSNLVIADCQFCGPSSGQSNPFDYGTWGVPTAHVFWVTNTGMASAFGLTGQLTAPFSFTGAGFPGANGTCFGTLGSGVTCKVEVQYNSPGMPGSASSSLSVTYNSGTVVRALVASSTNRARLLITDNAEPSPSLWCGDACGPHNFGNVSIGNQQVQTFTLFNTGFVQANPIFDQSAMLPPFDWANHTPFPGSTAPGSCGSVLGAGMSCTFAVGFFPTALGTFNSAVKLGYHDLTGPDQQVSRGIAGTGQ